MANAYSRNAFALLTDNNDASKTVTVGTDGDSGTTAQAYLIHRFTFEYDANAVSYAIQGSTDGTFWITIATKTTSGDGHLVDEPWAHLRVVQTVTGGPAGTNSTIRCEQMRPVALNGGLS